MPQNAVSLSLVHLTRPPRVAPEPGTRPPLLLLLHGVGSHERDLFGLASYLDDRFFVVSARAPLPHGDGFGWYPVQFTANGVTADEAKALSSRDRLQQFLGEVIAAYDLDPERVFFAGFSQGAIMSLYLSLHEPELVAGVVAMSGRLLPGALADRADDDRLTGLPILVVHGLYDRVLPISEGRRIQAELSQLPVALTYKEYPMDHEISAESITEVARFLRSQLDRASA